MQKKPQQISYTTAKTAFGIYLVRELREACGKDFPTETDVRKFLLRITPTATTADLQTARQISRYCQTGKDYLREAREETLDKVARVLNTPIKSFDVFREKINPLLKAYKYYAGYVDEAEAYLNALNNTDSGEERRKFCTVFSCDKQTTVYLSMISYNFGAQNKDLPAVSFGAESDLRTERIINELFDMYDLPSPQNIPGDIFFDSLDKQNNQTIFIAIGLFGNRLTSWMSNNNRLMGNLEILPGEKCIALNGKKYYADRDTGTDYALVCRKKINTTCAVFIIGGIEGFGTQRMGEYFETNWPDIYDHAAGADSFTMLYKTTKEVKLIEKVLE